MMRPTLIAVLMTLPACDRTGLRPIDSDSDTGSADTDTGDTDTADTDTGDTDTDTGDTDPPPRCPELVAPVETVDPALECPAAAALGTPVLEWSVEREPLGAESDLLVGPFFDTNKDGVVDGRDRSSVVVSWYDPDTEQHQTELLDGATGERQLLIPRFAAATLARGASDDGPTIWGGSRLKLEGYRMVRCTVDACEDALVWPDLKGHPSVPMVPTDVDHDGSYELIYKGGRYDPVADTTFEYSYPARPYMATAWDFDRDGLDTQFVGGGAVYEGDREACTDFGSSPSLSLPVAATQDAIRRKVVVQVSDTVSVAVPCERPLVEVALPEHHVARGHALGDVDGDGVADVVLMYVNREEPPSTNGFAAYSLEGERLWDIPGFPSGQILVYPTLVDLDGDGVMEVIGPGPAVYEGRTGTRLFALGESFETARMSDAGLDGRVAADIDGDGQVEIILQRLGRIEVYGGSLGWAPAPNVWHARAFWGTNVNPDLTIPADPINPWDSHSSFRAATGHGPVTGANTDPAARIVRVCEDECEQGVLRVGIQAGNLGVEPMRFPVELVLEGLRGETWETLHTQAYDSVPAATWLEGIDVEVPLDAPYDDLRVELVPVGWLPLRACEGAPERVAWQAAACR